MNPYEINEILDSDFDDDDSDKDPDYNTCKYLLMFINYYEQYIKIFCILNNLIIF